MSQRAREGLLVEAEKKNEPTQLALVMEQVERVKASGLSNAFIA